MLIVAPLGRDAEVIAEVAKLHCDVEILRDVSVVSHELAHGAAGLVMTEEALDVRAVKRLLVQLRSQPTWSDLPLLILVSHGMTAPRARDVVDAIAERANVTVLERPVRPPAGVDRPPADAERQDCSPERRSTALWSLRPGGRAFRQRSVRQRQDMDTKGPDLRALFRGRLAPRGGSPGRIAATNQPDWRIRNH